MTIPDWQTLSVILIVAGAIAFLGWKVLGGDRKPRRRRGPDVPIANLVRKRDASGRLPGD